MKFDQIDIYLSRLASAVVELLYGFRSECSKNDGGWVGTVSRNKVCQICVYSCPLTIQLGVPGTFYNSVVENEKKCVCTCVFELIDY